VTGGADRGEGYLGRKPRASSDVKDAHTPSNAGRAQNERHEVSRNMRKGSIVLGRRLPLKYESLHTVPCNSFTDGRFADLVDDGKSLKPAPSMIGGAVMTSLMLPLSGDLFEFDQPRLLSSPGSVTF
jgi:hypothetical protein